MKKKVFSKLLMVALVATVGAFTSCKDYDDDINDLRSRIDGLNTSLNTTVANKITAVESSIDLLSKQLSEVKADYAKADEALKTALEATDSKATVNASDILKLQQEVVTLKSTDANLQAAIDKLEAALKDASATLKTQGETLIGLAKTDEALEKGINEAKAQAENALTEAKKAQEAAATNAANLKSTDATLAALQNTVAENLKTVNSKIDSEITKLDTRIKTNETNIAALQTASAKAEANIVTINAKLEELAKKDSEISTKLDTELGKLAESLNTNVADLKTMINNAKNDLTEKIGEEATIRAKAISDLSDRVTANETAIAFIQEETIPNLIKNLREHLVPEYVTAEVAKQLPDALEVFMNKEVMPYVEDIVATETGKNKTLIDALTDKVKQDSIDLAAYTDAQFLLTAGLLAIYYDLDAEDLGDVPASALANAIAAGDSILQDNIDAVADALADEKDADKAGSLAALIAQIKNEADATSIAGKLKKLTNDFNDATNEAKAGSLANRFKTIEDFFAPAADDAEASDISVANLAAKIAETKSFTDAVNKAAADANGEILSMITAINLFANQHHAQADEYGKAVYTNGEEYRYAYGYDEFDHKLNFVYTVERGIWDAQITDLKEETWNFPDKYIRDDIDNTKWYSTRGKDETAKLDENYFDFVEGRYRSYEDSVLVRVSPVNADLRKAKIALLNSKGEDIIDAGLVELVDVQKYTREGYITRAAAGNETGLWVIKFKLNDAQVGEKYLQYAYWNSRPILYAVAVKTTGISEDEEGNLTSDGVERYVASEYDLNLATEAASHAYNFSVNETIVSKIHNRYIETEEGEAGAGAYWTDDPERNSFRYELYWSAPCRPETEPGQPATPAQDEETEKPWYYMTGCQCWFRPNGTEIDDCPDEDDFSQNNQAAQNQWGVGFTGYTYVYFDKNRDGYENPSPCYADINAKDRPGHTFSDSGQRQINGIDNRHLKDFLQIDFDHQMDGAMWAKIDIEFPATVCGVATPIRGFFVTLDQQFALESGNSEINAWVSYEYKNVGYYSVNKGVKDGRIEVPATLFKGNKGTIYIKDANNIVNGDVVGFRVHAVNLDGTLYDPDGRAFYVKFGKQETRHKLSFNVTVENGHEAAYAVQDLVDGKNPIKAFNDAQKAAGSDVRFFQRDQYPGSFIPEENYKIEYTWREGNPAIRANDGGIDAWYPVAGTESTYTVNEGTVKNSDYYSMRPTNFFDFYYSENADADIEAKTGDVENKWTYFNNTYSGDNGNKVAANRLTQSVRAQINAYRANRLIDGATYKITATIKRKDAQTDWRVVNIIDIDITKNMPSGLPKAFNVKSLQEGNINPLTFYVRPYAGELYTTASTPWQITWGDFHRSLNTGEESWFGKNTFAQNVGEQKVWDGTKYVDYNDAEFEKWHQIRWGVDAREYNFEEFFNGILVDTYDNNGNVNGRQYDVNYYFEFANTGSYDNANVQKSSTTDNWLKCDKDNASATALVTYADGNTPEAVDNPANPNGPGTRKAGYRMPKVYFAEVNKNANHEVKAGYIYRDISATLNTTDPAHPRFYAAGAYNIYPQASGIRNSDYKAPAIAFDKDGNEAETSVFQVKYACAFDKAVALKDSLEKGKYDNANGKPTKIMTQINYEDAKLYTITFKEDGSIATSDTTKAELKPVDVITTDWVLYTVDDKFLTPAAQSKTTGYWNAGLDALKKANGSEMTLTNLLKNGYLIIPNLDPSTIKFESLKAGVTKDMQPDGAALAYKPGDYFKWYYAKADGTKAYNSKDVAGIKFEIFHRTIDNPALTQNVHGYITFDVVNVWSHTKEKVKLYVKFARPVSQPASRATRR